MKFDTSKIANFDTMSAEDKLKAILEYEMEVPKDESKKYKDAFDKTASELASVKKQLSERMTEEERLKAEREAHDNEVMAELQALRREKSVSEHSVKFVGLGFSTELATSTANAMVDGKYDEVYANMQSFLSAKEKEITMGAAKGMPTPEGGKTPEDTDKMTDAEYYASLKKK